MTKHEAVKEYFQIKVIELAEKNIQFNFSPENVDGISIVTRYAGQQIGKFINGDTEKEYGFAIKITKPYSTDLDEVNIEAMNFAQDFMDWLEEQNRKKIFPNFGELCEVQLIENLQNMPNIAWVDPEAGIAQYMVQGRILYREKSKQSW